MASEYYDSAGKTVVDGDIAYAADLNDVNVAVDTAFQQVGADINTIEANQPFYADLAQKWAENPEDVPVEVGKFSSLHWAAKAEDQAILADADRVQTGLDRVATAADRVQVALDETQTNADRVQTGLDRVATAADRVQTGLDRTQVEALAAVMPAPISTDVGKSLTVMGDLSTSFEAVRGRKNYIIDGNFDIWLEATSQTFFGYGSDTMWYNNNNFSTKIHSRQNFTLGQTLVPGNPKYFSRTVVTSVAGADNYAQKQQKIESVLTLAGQKATLSFWFDTNASRNIAIEFVQNFGTGGSPSTSITGIGVQLVAVTPGFKKYVITVDVPSISGKTLGTANNDCLQIVFWFDAGTTSNSRTANLGQQSGTFDIAQVQLEEGEVATEFERMTVGETLALVGRYYGQSFPLGYHPANGPNATSFSTNYGVFCGSCFNTLASAKVPFNTIKRISPIITIYGNSLGYGKYTYDTAGTLLWAANAVAATFASPDSFEVIQGVVNAISIPVQFHWKADARL